MSVDVREKLRELINAQGQQVLSDPNKFTSLMLDLCLNTNEREINILATALTNKIPQHLQSSGSTSLTEELSSSLSHRLENETGLSTDAAYWAVNTWAEALGMVTVAGTGTKNTGKKRAPPELKTTIQTPPEVGPLETPVIGVDYKVLDFGKVIPGTIPSKTFTVRNHGTGILMGKISTTEPWIEISLQIFDVSSLGQTIAVTINSSLIPPKKHATGYINFESNGGPAKIEIKATAASKSKRGLKAWIIAAGITGMLIIIGIAILTASGDSAQAHLIAGQKYSDQKQWDKAIAEYNKAIEQDPKYALAYNNRAWVSNERGEFDKAITDLTRAIDLDPKLAKAYNNRGIIYNNSGAYDKAITDYTAAIELDPKDAVVYNNRGIAYNNSRNYYKAITDYTAAIELDPKDAVVYNNRGLTYYSESDFDKAIADFTKAIALNPEFADAYNNRGRVYSDKGDYDNVIADLTKTIELDLKINVVGLNAKLAEIYNQRGFAYGLKGDYDKAIGDLTKAIEFDPMLIMPYNSRGAAYGSKGEYDKAIADFDKAIELNPMFAFSYYGRGNAYYGKGDYDRAIAEFNEAIKLEPQFANAYNSRGYSYQQRGDYDKAIADYTKAIELDPMYVRAYNNRGYAYYYKGEYGRADADFKKAKDLELK